MSERLLKAGIYVALGLGGAIILVGGIVVLLAYIKIVHMIATGDY